MENIKKDYIDTNSVKKTFDERANTWEVKNKFIANVNGESERLSKELKENINKAHILADFGCGTGKVAKKAIEINQNIKIIAVDISEEMLKLFSQSLSEESKKRIELKNSSLYDTGIVSNSVDVVTMQQVLHHLEYPSNAINEAYRILKSNGKLMILGLTDLYQKEMFKYNSENMYEDIFGRIKETELIRLVENANFNVETIFKDRFTFTFVTFDDYYNFMDKIGVLPRAFRYHDVSLQDKKKLLYKKYIDKVHKNGSIDIKCEYITIIARK